MSRRRDWANVRLVHTFTPPLQALDPAQIDDHAERGERFVWGARLSECVLPPGDVPEHAHPHDGLAYLLGGSLQECLDGVWYDVAAGRVLRQFRGRSHRLRVGPRGAHVFRVRFRLDADLPLAGRPDAPAQALAVMQQTYRQFLGKRDCDLVLLAWIVDAERTLCGASRAARGPEPRWLDEVEQQVLSSTDADGFCALARHVGVSPGSLLDAFARRHGCRPAELARRQRVFASCLPLRTGTSLSTVASDFGYADQAHFSRCFKRYLGLSPGAYRRASLA